MQIMFALAERRGYPISENWPELIAAVDEGSASSPPGRVARGRVPDGGGHARRPMPVIGGGKPPQQDVRRAPAPRPPAARR